MKINTYDLIGPALDWAVSLLTNPEWEHYATFITMESAQEFAKSKGENCRVYVDSGCRNHEWKALRAFLLSIDHARRVEGES